MYVIIGGTGRVGSAVVRSLSERGEPVRVVTRRADRAEALRRMGVEVAVCDIRDVERSRRVFRSGRRAFLLNPPADPSCDTDVEERANVAAIVDALQTSDLEKVVLASTYGARAGERCGDLTVLYEFEERLDALSIPAAINRGAYYHSNWSPLLSTARATGKLPSFLPADLELPMVAPEDLGAVAAARLLSPITDTGVRHVEGPRVYSPRDVAAAFTRVLGRTVEVEEIPRDAWEATFRGYGFSETAAASYARMTAVVVDGGVRPPDEPIRCGTSLEDHLAGVSVR